MELEAILPVSRPRPRILTPTSLAQQSTTPVQMHDQGKFTERLAASALANDRSFLDGLDDHERMLAVQILRELAESPDMESLTLDRLWEVDYWDKPVGIDQFLEDPYYMGGDQTKELYPIWQVELRKLFAPNARYTEWCLGGSLGCGKTTAAMLANHYVIYRNACLRDPHRYYGLQKGNDIVYIIFSLTGAQANEVGYGKLKSNIDSCPWFNEKYPRIKRIESAVKFKKHKASVMYGSQIHHSVGRDIFCIAEGQEVLTDHGNVAVEKITQDMKLVTPTGLQDFRSVDSAGLKECIQIETEDGICVVSEDHLFLARGADGSVDWVKAVDLTLEYTLVDVVEAGSSIREIEAANIRLQKTKEGAHGAESVCEFLRSDEGSAIKIARVGPRRCYDIMNVSGLNCYTLSNNLVTHNSFAEDEANFMGMGASGADSQKRAQSIYTESRNRITSRFSRAGGMIAGMSFLISSKKSVSSFLETHLKSISNEIAAGRTLVSEFSQWEAKPHVFSTTTFKVEVGDRVYPSRILEPGMKPRDGARVIDVPDDDNVVSSFKKDIDQALRDLAGIATFGVAPMFRDRSLFSRAVRPELQHPFTRDEFMVSTSDDLQIHTFFKPEVLFKIENSVYTLRNSPQAHRFFHVDLGVRHDAAGIAVAHVAGIETIERVRPDGTKFRDMLPIVVPDIILRLVPAPGYEISIEKIRTFLYHLKATGMPIIKGSYDGWQSIDSVQQMTSAGWDVETLSMDRTDEQYMMLKQSFIEGRIQMYNYPPVIRELCELEYDLDKKKVDHAEGKAEDGREHSKDVADGLCGAVYHCLTDIRARQSMSKLDLGWKGSRLFQGPRQVSMSKTSVPWSSMDKDRRTAQRTSK